MRGLASVEMWVGNARQAAAYLSAVFGFRVVAYGRRSWPGSYGADEQVSYVLEQGTARLIVTGPAGASSLLWSFLRLHGDAVRDISLHVDDASSLYADAVAHGALPCCAPWTSGEGRHGVLRATIGGPGELTHTLISGEEPPPALWPVDSEDVGQAIGISGFDAIQVAVEHGAAHSLARFYERVMGLKSSTDEQGVTTVSGREGVLIRMEEPLGREHVAGFLRANAGPGVSTIVFTTPDLPATVAALTARGVLLSIDPDGPSVQADPPAGTEGRAVHTPPLTDRSTLRFALVEREPSVADENQAQKLPLF